MPASRPRSSSGIVWFQMVERPRPLSMSPAPAKARQSSTSQTFPNQPAAAIARPQAVAPRPRADRAAAPSRSSRWSGRAPASRPSPPRTSGRATSPRPARPRGTEDRVREGEEHRRQVDRVRAQQHRPRPGVPGALRDARSEGFSASCAGGAGRGAGTSGPRPRSRRPSPRTRRVPASATTRPAIEGPAMAPICQRSEFSAAAAVWCSCGTIRAKSESSAAAGARERGDAGRDHVQRPEHRLRQQRVDQQDRGSVPRPASVHRITRRRSTASASAPPYRPNTTSGTSSTAPIAPTASGEFVSSLIWSGRAIIAIALLKNVTSPCTHRSRKSREARQGARSGRRAESFERGGHEGSCSVRKVQKAT